jgi:hypothetical protein
MFVHISNQRYSVHYDIFSIALCSIYFVLVRVFILYLEKIFRNNFHIIRKCVKSIKVSSVLLIQFICVSYTFSIEIIDLNLVLLSEFDLRERLFV